MRDVYVIALNYKQNPITEWVVKDTNNPTLVLGAISYVNESYILVTTTGSVSIHDGLIQARDQAANSIQFH